MCVCACINELQTCTGGPNSVVAIETCLVIWESKDIAGELVCGFFFKTVMKTKSLPKTKCPNLVICLN